MKMAKKEYGFSKEIFEMHNNYLESKLGGYLGHRNRTPQIDSYLEAEVRKTGMSLLYFIYWLPSSDARRMMDYIFDYGGMVKKIDHVLLDIHNNGLIYSDPTHSGTAISMLRIAAEREAELWSANHLRILKRKRKIDMLTNPDTTEM
jgi:hypothetical protein